MTKRRLLSIVSIVLILSFILTGCGSSDSGKKDEVPSGITVGRTA